MINKTEKDGKVYNQILHYHHLILKHTQMKDISTKRFSILSLIVFNSIFPIYVCIKLDRPRSTHPCRSFCLSVRRSLQTSIDCCMLCCVVLKPMWFSMHAIYAAASFNSINAPKLPPFPGWFSLCRPADAMHNVQMRNVGWPACMADATLGHDDGQRYFSFLPFCSLARSRRAKLLSSCLEEIFFLHFPSQLFSSLAVAIL